MKKETKIFYFLLGALVACFVMMGAQQLFKNRIQTAISGAMPQSLTVADNYILLQLLKKNEIDQLSKTLNDRMETAFLAFIKLNDGKPIAESDVMTLRKTEKFLKEYPLTFKNKENEKIITDFFSRIN